MKKQENHKNHLSRDHVMLGGGDLWTNGLICAFEFVRSRKKTVQSKSGSKVKSAPYLFEEIPKKQVSTYDPTDFSSPKVKSHNQSKSSPAVESEVTVKDMFDDHNHSPHCDCGHLSGREEALPRSYWVPIGWDRISELVQTVKVDAGWEPIDFLDEEDDDVTVADLAAPYWERPVGPTWWCHVDAGHPFINAWLSSARWIHPAICIALRDESKLISERMKHLLYEVPVRVAGGLLFELLGQSAGDPLADEDDIPTVLRSWQAQNFLVTALHVKGFASNINVLGITEVQELLAAGGNNIPRTIHEVIAHLASRLAQWDDRLFRKFIFGAADEAELKLMNRRNQEDMHLFSIILNQEIRRLSTQVIRVKWSLHAREEIVFELLQHLRGNRTWVLLEGIRKTTREMIQEQEAVRGRLFTIQDVMQSTVRAWLQVYMLLLLTRCGLGLYSLDIIHIIGFHVEAYATTITLSLSFVFTGGLGLYSLDIIHIIGFHVEAYATTITLSLSFVFTGGLGLYSLDIIHISGFHVEAYATTITLSLSFVFTELAFKDRSLTVTHNLGVFGGCGLILSIITGLFGINVDGIPGNDGSPYAFALFSGILFLVGSVLIAIGLVYLGLKKPINDENVEVRKLELEELVRMFQQEAESHAQVQKLFLVPARLQLLQV
ncbi:hypothetical protein JRO89_XS01G0380000 [Xanthoceras sorbifolium]|uniref:Uncharacterized protein n=1 Tax=Xanthoceras sorbifolium TaxID=99658 RepID=A0ABQ8IPT0_9ROSI|nr:hypothetical protein JRO89_XS01G0380000 [Xanthoceras sorbifolium]